MSALGQKRTFFTVSLYVRFAPENGHRDHRTACPLSDISDDGMKWKCKNPVPERMVGRGLEAEGFLSA
jgi:hypothetical protein